MQQVATLAYQVRESPYNRKQADLQLMRKILFVIALTAVVFATVLSVFIGWRTINYQPAAEQDGSSQTAPAASSG
ncbi:hypothetical protein [Paracoccus fistulariae]|uniref:Uncharacterized protein n=1 Tax=Paracoccus fistulariae TaxID=658446 RepID=A0ABY7SMN8_9RHOB|nr:hypothetical protein [Paracoccus fistulariae]MDB6180065.1 hypothetical protein [Paracoccus fistulariae]WCR08154.1 hypothetical protein JHX87_04885 [Paracoccus fistulariae]